MTEEVVNRLNSEYEKMGSQKFIPTVSVTNEAEDVVEIFEPSEAVGVIETVEEPTAVNDVFGTTERLINTGFSRIRKANGIISADSDTVTITLSEDEATTNGIVVVEYDKEELNSPSVTFGSAVNVKAYYVNEDEGTVKIVYAARRDVPADTVIATVVFDTPCEENAITVTTLERNVQLDLEEVQEETIEGKGHDLVPVYDVNNNIVYYECADCGARFVDAEGTIPYVVESVIIKGSSLVLEGVIQVQFRVIVPDIEDKNVVIKFTGGNANNSYEESSDATERRYKIKETEAGTECYYRVPVYAKQMNDKVNIWFTDKEGNRVSFYTGSGVDVTETGYEYSVAKYIDNKWNDDDEKLRELVRAMKYYGLYAMKNFKYEVELADSILAELEPMSDVEISLLEEYAYNKEGAAPAGLSAASFSLTLEEDIRINYKLNVGEGVNFKNYSIKLDGKKATPVQNDSGDWYVYKANIKAKDMDTMHELTISKGEESIVYRYGVLSYCYSKLSNSSTSEKLKNLCKAIYWYSKAADAYWGQ